MRYLIVLLFSVFCTSLAIAETKVTPTQARFFESRIRPLLIKNCFRCHGARRQKSELRLDAREHLLKGGTRGSAVDEEHPEKSLLLKVVQHRIKDLEMPPTKKLTRQEIADLTHWINDGAPWPVTNASVKKSEQHWAFQPITNPQFPTVKNPQWAQTPIDHFILAELEKNSLSPSPIADKRALIRRATFDLHGLPPTPEEIDNFLKDDSPNAFEKVLERLLASPKYGERWGRHWLDVARYADSNGLDENVAHGNAWRYRDYVIDAFNKDKPYDRFVIEQLAGDLLPFTTDQQRNEQLIATGYLSLGPKVLAEVDETKMEMDIVDEQIDTVSRSFLGLTMGCARCHDHKFDPIETADYYALAGIFRSTKTMDSFTKIAKWHENPLNLPNSKLAEHQRKVADQKAKLKKLQEKVARQGENVDVDAVIEIEELKKQIAALEKSPPQGPTAMGVLDGSIADAKLHVRGSHLNLGNVISRRVPKVLAGEKPPQFNNRQSGRMELAKWMVNRDHPLTARVMVNRIWRWHFGKGLVKSTDNFGHLGDPPTHPQLLDYLATQFMDQEWSLKQMHKQILLSSTWQQTSTIHSQGLALDPENRLYWRRDVQRLEAEAIRDSLLSISNLLDEKMGGSLLHVKNREFIFNHTSKDQTSYQTQRRSVYLPVVRNHLYDVFQLFDCTDATVMSGNRSTTTIAPQALFMMNSKFVINVSQQLAKQAMEQKGNERVAFLYQRAYGRLPHKEEAQRAIAFVQQLQAEGQSEMQAWECLSQVIVAANEFVYVR